MNTSLTPEFLRYHDGVVDHSILLDLDAVSMGELFTVRLRHIPEELISRLLT